MDRFKSAWQVHTITEQGESVSGKSRRHFAAELGKWGNTPVAESDGAHFCIGYFKGVSFFPLIHKFVFFLPIPSGTNADIGDPLADPAN